MDKKALLSMSMTELYALSVVAYIAFMRAILTISQTIQTSTVSYKFHLAVEVVRSCSSLLYFLWWKMPTRRLQSLQFYLFRAQNMALSHKGRVHGPSQMPDSNFLELLNARTPSVRKTHRSKLHQEWLTAVQTLHKPNIPILLELVISTLPMIGHVSGIGELVLEKAHQILEYAIKSSNSKDVQIQSIQGAIFHA